MAVEIKKVEVTEIFSSLQGEGKRCGVPATFVRLRRCNLACTWCDQRETWDPNDPGYQNFEEKHISEIREEVVNNGNRLLVITGGEPLLWQKELRYLVDSMPADVSVEIESNGTIDPSFLKLTRAEFNISPKMSNSENGERNTGVHEEYLDLYKLKRVVFKFVVKNSSDFEEIDNFVEENSLDPKGIYIMPEGVDRETICLRLPFLFGACNKRVYNLTTRLHVLAFGYMKGV